MELGLIGLGKMGGNMRERLRRAGHTVVGYDRKDKTQLQITGQPCIRDGFQYCSNDAITQW